MTKGIEYYRLNEILKENAPYNIIVGERSNGKTYSVLEHIIKEYIQDKSQGAVIRRFREAIRGKRASTLFSPLDDFIERETEGFWTHAVYRSNRFYLAKEVEENKLVLDATPFCFTFALSESEHDKSTSYPNVKNILFDEFITRRAYLHDEFMLFMNTLSTIIRNRDNIRIFMLGNTVNKYCPYFNELGITHIDKQEQGSIDVYSIGESDLKVAVEYCAPMASKKSNKYFAFDNPKLHMIKHGVWELDIYPRLPFKYKPKEVVLDFFIDFDNALYHGEIIEKEGALICFIHPKTTPIKSENDIIFTHEVSPLPNVFSNFSSPIARIHKKIYQLFQMQKVFYSDNSTGEAIANFIKQAIKKF